MTYLLASLVLAAAVVAVLRARAPFRIGGFAIRFPDPPRRDRRRHAQYVQAGTSPIWIQERALKGVQAVCARLRRIRRSAAARGN